MTFTDVVVSLAFYSFAILAVVGGVGVIRARRVVHSALFLVVSLASVAVLYILLSADFLFAVQVLIYVGAIMILMLFAIMLTPQQVELPAMVPGGQRLLVGLLAVGFFLVVGGVVLSTPWPQSTPLNQSTLALIGRDMFTTWVLPLQIAALLLTAAMVGAIVIAREE